MKKSPSLLNHKAIERSYKTTVGISEGAWVPARPIGYFGLLERIRLAWGVFTGRYDAFKWPGDQ